MSPTTNIVLEEEGNSKEAVIHKLKLQWVMVEDDAEKRRISEEIRQRLQRPTDR